MPSFPIKRWEKPIDAEKKKSLTVWKMRDEVKSDWQRREIKRAGARLLTEAGKPSEEEDGSSDKMEMAVGLWSNSWKRWE